MYIANLRVTHKKGAHEVLDRMALTDSALDDLYDTLLGKSDIDEAVVLTTCNRFEIFHSGNNGRGEAQAKKVVLDNFGAATANYLISDSFLATLEHLFRVSASLESLIVGEDQILGQVKDAFAYAADRGFSSKVLNLVFRKAISVGKKVRSDTGICDGKVSIPSAAIELANEHRPVRDKTVLLVGTGNMASSLARYITEFGPKELVVMGRTPEKLEKFCATHSGCPADFGELGRELERADLIFSATACPHVLITREMIEEATGEGRRGLTLIDIAMPSDIDPTVKEIPGVRYFSIDSLKEISCKNIQARRTEIARAEEIISGELARFKNKLKNLHLENFLSELNVYIEDIRRRELDRSFKMLETRDNDIEGILEGFSRSFKKKIMHNFLIGVKRDRTPAEDMERFLEIFTGNGNVSEHTYETVEE